MMTFCQALKWLRRGKKISRNPGVNHYELRKSDKDGLLEILDINMTGEWLFDFTTEDLFASDWVIVK